MQDEELVNESLMKRIIDVWKKAAAQLDERFDLIMESLPQVGRLVSNSENCKNMIGSFDGKTIYLSEDVIEGSIPFDSAVSMISFQYLFLNKSICTECIEDFAFEFGRQFLPESEQERWLEVWAAHQNLRDELIRDSISPYRALPRLSRIGGPGVLSTLVRELEKMHRSNIPFEIDDYLYFLSERYRKFTVSLTKTELKLIDRILHNNSTDLSIISSEVGVSPQWVSRKISELGKKGILVYTSNVPYSKIGIRMFHLMACVNEKKIDIVNYLANCPFVYSYRRIIAGTHQLFALVTIPDNPQSIRAIQKGVKLLSNLGVDIDLFEIVSSGVSNSLDHYDSHKGQWDIPWDLLRIELQKIVRDDLAGIFPKRDVPARMTTVHIDELDLKILEFTYKKDISVAKIRKRFKIGQEKARSHLNKLRTSGLITVNWHVHQIGLNESIIVATSDEHIGLSIAAWSQRLPYSVVSYVSDNSVFLRAELPSGGGHGLSAAVRTIDPTATVNLIDKPIRGPWTFPFELWDVKKQMWKCPEKKLSDWLRSIS